MNSRMQVTSGIYGSSLNTTSDYGSYGFLNYTTTGSLQNYNYSFDMVTGNLNWRKNVIQANIQENFEYDNLDRLDRVYRGSTTLLDMAYDSNKGGITTKSDAGTLNYNISGKPYALGTVNPSAGLMPTKVDSLTYTSFESVNTISEGNFSAYFTYNSDNERARMEVKQSGNTILTRWYHGGSFISEVAGGVTKDYTFIGGDAYSAPVVAITQSGTTTYYNLLRDHLGSITHVVNASNNTLLYEYSYDSWGRMRNISTWTDFAPGSEPSLFVAGRGFTGHEHLPWFNLINMNGRVYDPLVGQFLSPDNHVQAPYFTQSLNRYGYCLNNPLIYTDKDGESFWLAVGIYALYTYLYNAYENRNQETGNWAWNPASWSNSTVVVGASTNSGLSNYTIYGSIGSGYNMPAISYNTTYGIGVGNANNPGFTEFYYPSINYSAPIENALNSFEKGRNRLILTYMCSSQYEFCSVSTIENFNSVVYKGMYYDNAEEMRNQLHHMSDMQGGVELILAEDYYGGAYLLPSKVYNGKEWMNNGPDNAYVSNYHLNILNLDKANIKMFGHDHDRSYRFTDPADYNLFNNWRKSIYIIMPDGRILYKHYPTGVEYNHFPGY